MSVCGEGGGIQEGAGAIDLCKVLQDGRRTERRNKDGMREKGTHEKGIDWIWARAAAVWGEGAGRTRVSVSLPMLCRAADAEQPESYQTCRSIRPGNKSGSAFMRSTARGRAPAMVFPRVQTPACACANRRAGGAV